MTIPSSSTPGSTHDEPLDQYCERHLKQSEPLTVCEAVELAIESEQNIDAYVQWLYARALTLCSPGTAGAALDKLETKVEELAADERFCPGKPREQAMKRALEEVLGLRARCHKTLWELSDDQTHLKDAYVAYRAAYQRTGQYWTGINAATLGRVHGEAAAEDLAHQVLATCQTEKESDSSYWLHATMAEAELVLGKLEAARAAFQTAVSTGSPDLSQQVSTRKNARALLKVQGGKLDALDDIFGIPKVAVFGGHMIDAPGRLEPRFPAAMEGRVAGAIRECLERYGIGMGFAGAACGADILFHEALLDRGGESTVVLPQRAEAFRAESVDFAGPAWTQRFDRLLATIRTKFGTQRVCAVSQSRLKLGSVSYEFANRVMIGLALAREREIASQIVPIVLWDGEAGDGFGGTATCAARMLTAFGRVVKIDLKAIRDGRNPTVYEITSSPSASLPPESGQTAISAILFADVAGFSGLTDDENPLFVEHFMGLVAEELKDQNPIVKNTWGDGLFIVFANPGAAGRFALRLRDAVKRRDWSRHGLPELGLRIGLHAGPGYFATDPVTGVSGFIGGHVSYAARIEPVALKNEVFATLQYAALVSETRVSDFRAEYAGLRELPKQKTKVKVPLWRLEWAQ